MMHRPTFSAALRAAVRLLLWLSVFIFIVSLALMLFAQSLTRNSGESLQQLVGEHIPGATLHTDAVQVAYSLGGVHLRAEALTLSYAGAHLAAARADFWLQESGTLKIALHDAALTLALAAAADESAAGGGGAPAVLPALPVELSAPQAQLALPAAGLTLTQADIFAQAADGAWLANLSQGEALQLRAGGDAQHPLRLHAVLDGFAAPPALAAQFTWRNLRATLAARAGADGVHTRIATAAQQLTDVQRGITLRGISLHARASCRRLAQCRHAVSGNFSARAANAAAALSLHISNANWRRQGAQWQLFAPLVQVADDAAAAAAASAWQTSLLINANAETRRFSLRTAVPLPHAAAQMLTVHADSRWHSSADGSWQVFARELLLAQDAATVRAQALWRGGAASLTAYAVTGTLTGLPLTAVARHLPPGEVRQWAEESLLGGVIAQAQIAFSDAGGAAPPLLRLSAAFARGTLDIAEGWAPAENLHGTLLLRADDMHISGSGVFDGISVTALAAHLPALSGAQNTLLLSMRSAPATLGALFAAARRLPATRDFMRQAEAALRLQNRGSGELQLSLRLPLAQPQDAQVRAALAVRGGGVQAEGLPLVRGVRGEVHFSNATYGGTLSGRLADAAADAPRLTVAFDDAHLTVHGVADVSLLLAVAGVHGMPLAGSTPFTVARTAESTLFSASLDGTVIDLPAPLGKGGFEPASLRASLAAAAAEVHYATRQATLHARLGAEGGADIAINSSAAAPPASGINLHGSAPGVDLDLWLAAQSGGGEHGLRFATLLLTLNGSELSGITNERFVVSGGGGGGAPLSLYVDASHSRGEVVFAAQQLRGDFSYLSIPLAGDAPSGGGGGSQIASLTLHLVAGTLVVGGLTLGGLTLAGAPRGDIWQISTLHIASAHSTLHAGGTYENAHTYLSMHLEVGALPELMTILQIPQVFGGGRISLFGSFGWPGAPTDFSPAKLIGDMRLLGEGVQYLDVDFGTGVVNFLSIFSPQSLFSLGFAELGKGGGIIFDTVQGDVRLESGEARFLPINLVSRDLRMDIQGSTDFVYRRYNIHGRVRPGEKLLDAGAVVGIGTGLAALNPATLVGGALLGKIFEKPVSEIGAYDYTITGTWEEPVYKEIGITEEEDAGSEEGELDR